MAPTFSERLKGYAFPSYIIIVSAACKSRQVPNWAPD
jgi:SAM-dependent methyltransferase